MNIRGNLWGNIAKDFTKELNSLFRFVIMLQVLLFQQKSFLPLNPLNQVLQVNLP